MKKIVKNTFFVSATALLSRMLGVLRDVLIAHRFGADISSDIFFLCFRIPDFLRKMFSEGILSSSFVPVFSKYLARDGEKSAFEMASSVFSFVSIFTTTVTIFGIIFAPFAVKLFLPQLSSNTYEFNLAVLLSRIMMPYFIFICLLAVCMGVLNSMENFKIPSFAPIVFNMVIIFFAIIVCDYFNPPIIGLALGVVIGGIAQLALQIPSLIKKQVFKIRNIRIFHPGVILIIKKIFPAIVGASSFHINLLSATFFASFLPQGSVSYLYYADRLVQLPMVLVSTSLAIVVLPVFSENSVAKTETESIDILLKGLKSVFFIIIPAMAGLIIIREPLIKLFFYHGAFNLISVNETSACLLFLIFGLWTYSGTRVIVSFFYAYSNMKTPLYAGLFAIFLNIILSLILMNIFGLKGLALAISISGAFNFTILFSKLYSIARFSLKDIGFSACRALFVSGIMCFVIKLLIFWLNGILGYEVPILINVAISVVIGVLVYFGVNILIKSPEIR
ncbi:MAG: murein biosynthesis integral membrane protein MurJ, partial [Desulfobacteraceae bacterium]|nr:murein biosynthesis integral membrane protein MurJ [Desulfobacteraceae bacterium]